MRISFVLGVIGVMVMVSAVAGADETFRLAALEYEGRTPSAWSSNSNTKMQVLYDGIDHVLTQQAVAGTPIDMLVTSETPTWVGGEDGYMGQAIPGPRSFSLASLAVTHNTWIVSGLLELVEDVGAPSGYRAYNSAVVFNRQGQLVAKYRKVHLPPQEFGGNIHPYGVTNPPTPITPGDGPMVIDTEFGAMAVMICFEVSPTDAVQYGFTEYLGQVMAMQPDFLVHPTWGNFNGVLGTIADDNDIYVATSAWAGASAIIGPDGTTLDEQYYSSAVPTEMKVAVMDIPVFASPATPGDTDIDGDVDGSDLAVIGLRWDPAGLADNGWADGDFDADGDVDGSDLAVLGMNWNPAGSSVPEPGSMGLIAVAGAWLFGGARRRARRR